MKKTKENQKKIAKQYNYLIGKYIECFYGRVPSAYKMVAYEISLIKKENQYGDYKSILPKIKTTFFNGKLLKLDLIDQNQNLGTLSLPLATIEEITICLSARDNETI